MTMKMSLKIVSNILPSLAKPNASQMTTPQKPTIVIVHGAMHSPAHYGPMVSLLNLEGYDAFCPALPTCHEESVDTKMQQDADCIREEIVSLLGFKREIVVVMHCYGGIVGTEAIDETLTRSWRAAHGLMGGVTQLVYVSALLLSIGSSMETAFNRDEEDVLYKKKGELFKQLKPNGRIKLRNPDILFVGDVKPPQRQRWAKLLTSFYFTPTTEPLSRAAYEYIPSTYIFCNEDRFISMNGQKRMVDAAVEAGIAIRTEELNAGHNPFLNWSNADKIIDVIASLP